MKAQNTKSVFVLFLSLILLALNFQHGESVGPSPSSTTGEWCYWEDPECAPDTWTGTCATGRLQSPINLNEYVADGYSKLVTPFNHRLGHLYGHQNLSYSQFGIQNTGHSVQITFPASTTPILIDPFYPNNGKPYTFAQAHFHWGLGNRVNGSEHNINGKVYDGELHLVHFASQYGNFSNALAAKSDLESVLVIGILLELTDLPNPALASIISAVPSIAKYDPNLTTVHRAEPLNLEELFPALLEFFHYHGSLTSPTCDEQVLWLVHKYPIPISSGQLAAFRQVEDVRGLKLKENFRHLQKKNGRYTHFYNVQIN